MRVKRSESGQIMPMVSLLMVVIIGIAAFAIDGSNVYSQHRKFQADLDVAVKITASDLFDVDPTTPSYTTTIRVAISAGAQILANDGYTSTLVDPNSTDIAPIGGDYHNGFCGSSAGITFCTPPRTGPFQGAGHFSFVEATLARNVGGFFGGVLGIGVMGVSVRAVAWHGGFHQPYAIIGLDPTGCSVAVQNTASSLTVNGSIMADGQSCVKGGTALVYGHSDATLPTTNANGSQIAGNGGTNTGVPPIVDPYSPPPLSPSPTTPAIVADPGVGVDSVAPGCSTVVSKYAPTTVPANTHYYFPPANGAPAVVTGFKISQDAYYFFPHCDGSPAIYYFSRGPNDMDVSGTPAINSFNAVFVLDSSNNLIKETGQAKWVLNAPTSGLYQGIALSEAQPCAPTNNLTLAGGANSLISGVIDAPCAAVTVTGDSTDNPFVNGAIVGYDVTVAGNGSAIVTYDPSATPADKGSVLVE